MRDALRHAAPHPGRGCPDPDNRYASGHRGIFKNDRAEFIRTVQETQAAQQTADISKKRKRLAAAQKRAGELEKLICKIYEDNALGKLPDARYEALDAQYAKEQEALNAEIAELKKAVTGYEQSRKSAEKFIALIDKYENFDTLTNTMLNEFVEKILVHERARKGSRTPHRRLKSTSILWAGISRPPCSRFP